MTGGVLVTVGLVGLTYGLIEGPAQGWTSPGPLAALAAGVLLLAAFVGWEHRSPRRCCSSACSARPSSPRRTS